MRTAPLSLSTKDFCRSSTSFFCSGVGVTALGFVFFGSGVGVTALGFVFFGSDGSGLLDDPSRRWLASFFFEEVVFLILSSVDFAGPGNSGSGKIILETSFHTQPRGP